MLKSRLILVFSVALLCSLKLSAQTDSSLDALKEIPVKYIKDIDNKVDKYSKRITSKTEKTLAKLARWEGKIKLALEKASPQTAQRMFGNNQLTFSGMLQKFRNGESMMNQYRVQYDGYKDKLTTNLKYLENQKSKLDEKLLKPLAKTKAKVDSFSIEMDNSEILQQLIRERKKQLLDAAFQLIGKNKYLNKINKETWYYMETMRNYKSLFSSPEKSEQTVRNVLGKIPAFQNFAKDNSQLASIFGLTGSTSSNGTMGNQGIMGLQTRAGVQNAIRASLGSNGSAQQMIQQNVQKAQGELNSMRNELIKKGGSGNELSMPDFKPNMQKTKTFWQRMEFGTDIQFAKHNTFMPTTADISLSAGYKLNDKSVIGLGASYRTGLGTIDKIRVTNQGVGLRSYVDWKLKHQIFLSGGFEMNYNTSFTNFSLLKNADVWQQSALVGVSKKIKVNAKWFKATKLQLLVDLLARHHVPVSQPVLFRVGYNF